MNTLCIYLYQPLSILTQLLSPGHGAAELRGLVQRVRQRPQSSQKENMLPTHNCQYKIHFEEIIVSSFFGCYNLKTILD